MTTTRTGERHRRRTGQAVIELASPTPGAHEGFPLELVHDDDFTVEVPRTVSDRAWSAAKRGLDIVGALILLVALAPLMLLVALAIRLESSGNVLFAHRRLGRDGRHFDCLKFRSMHCDAEHALMKDETLLHEYVSNHFKIPCEQDPRVTRFGRFLRKSSIDELPQLWNVLVGDMSLVGPRPIVALEANYYGERLPMLLSMRPGITGAWAISGRSRIGYPERVDLELQYVEKWRLSTDISILIQTPWTVLTQRGVI